MISNSELQYVDKLARHAPFPGKNYAASVMDELANAHKVFKEKFDGKQYSLILSNGEEFHFAILPKNLPHLLGMDFKNLSSEAMHDTVYEVLGIDSTEYNPAYDYLKAIIERADEVIKNDGTIGRYKILNYFKSMVKSSAFSKISDFENFNFGVINCNNQVIDENSQENTGYINNINKFIFTENDEILLPYSIMGFVENNSSDTQEGIYVPKTLLLPRNFGEIVDGKELVLPIHLLVNDENELSKKSASASEKYKLLRKYLEICQNSNAYINIFNAYENDLKCASQEEERIKRLKK